jgi:hypothetical protein
MPSIAMYYLRIANQLVVDDTASGDDGAAAGFVMLTADMSLRLISCVGGRGLEDFNRLVMDGQVQCSKETLEAASVSASRLRSQDSLEDHTPLR